MVLAGDKKEKFEQLQKEMLNLQGYRNASISQQSHTGLGIIEQSFPNKTFPTGAVHELISYEQEQAAATSGFISGIVSKLMKTEGICLWIGKKRLLFPPALSVYGIPPDRVIFINPPKDKDILWAIEEALKCDAITTVVGELSELNFTESRRLQLAVEESRVTGFIHRYRPKSENTVACITRWKIKPVNSELADGLPGVGFPRWDVQLLKVRNGKPGRWQLEWSGSRFHYIRKPLFAVTASGILKTG